MRTRFCAIIQATCTGSSREALGLGASFAHPSEERFARLLDFYRVRWEYEPHTYPVTWDASGHVTERFTPDFWLPELAAYVELTTLRQSLVTRKNRKLRHFRALYPDKRVHLLYRGDLERLATKYASRSPRARSAFHHLMTP